MAKWRVEFERRALKELKKIGSADRVRMLRFLHDRLANHEDPRELGKALTADLAGIWSYRVGDMRILTQFDNGAFIVLVIAIGNWREIYR